MGISMPVLGVPGLLGGFNKNTVPGLVHWIKANDLATLYQNSDKTGTVSNGTPVGAWLDQINGEYLQTTTAKKPTYRASVAALNNKPALQFDGGDYLQGAWGALIAQPVTYFVVGQFTTVGANYYMVDGEDDTNRVVFLILNTNVYAINAGTSITGGTPNTSAHIFTIKHTAAASTLYVDGVSVLTGDAGAGGTDGITIGARWNGDSPMIGYVAEKLWYAGDLSASRMNTVQNYLSGSFGINITEF